MQTEKEKQKGRTCLNRLTFHSLALTYTLERTLILSVIRHILMGVTNFMVNLQDAVFHKSLKIYRRGHDLRTIHRGVKYINATMQAKQLLIYICRTNTNWS